jgi:hypothetical protein
MTKWHRVSPSWRQSPHHQLSEKCREMNPYRFPCWQTSALNQTFLRLQPDDVFKPPPGFSAASNGGRAARFRSRSDRGLEKRH